LAKEARDLTIGAGRAYSNEESRKDECNCSVPTTGGRIYI